jgi:hypothetical protein
MALESTQPLTEILKKKHGGKGRPARRADNRNTQSPTAQIKQKKKGKESIYYLTDHQLLKEEYIPCN